MKKSMAAAERRDVAIPRTDDGRTSRQIRWRVARLIPLAVEQGGRRQGRCSSGTAPWSHVTRMAKVRPVRRESPSLLYAVELLAWHLFFGLSVLLAGLAFPRCVRSAAAFECRCCDADCFLTTWHARLLLRTWTTPSAFSWPKCATT
jgi:hypothetical protein